MLDTIAAEFLLHRIGQPRDVAASLGEAAARVRGMVSNPMLGLSTELIDALPSLEIVALAGVGLERIDLDHARERGVVVTTTPVLYEDVADLAVLLAMTASRRATEGDRWLRTGHWSSGTMGEGKRFSLKHAGILGMGRIGRMLAARLAAFGMPIGYYDPIAMPDLDYIPYASAAELARESEFLFLCASGAPGERHVVTAEVLDELGPEGIFVNVARGWLVDETALVDAVTTRTIRAAGLDVFDNEPDVPAPLREADNVVLTPHIGSNTVESHRAMDDNIIDNMRCWFSNKGAVTPVT
ncbi:MAG: 2-hydroxyacid dehydrogenase [Nocardioidaceae bacterium]